MIAGHRLAVFGHVWAYQRLALDDSGCYPQTWPQKPNIRNLGYGGKKQTAQRVLFMTQIGDQPQADSERDDPSVQHVPTR